MTDGTDDQTGAASDQEQASTPPQTAGGFGWKKIVVLTTVAALFAVLFFMYREQLSLAAIASQEEELRAYGKQHSALVIGLSFLIYVAVTGLNLPGALALTIVIGWLFRQLFGTFNGVLTAVVVVSFASTLGATLAFLLSRFLFRDAIQSRFGAYLKKFNEALEREGAFYLFTLRLIPAVPFFVINAVMGLTPMRTRTFWWVSQLGMLAGTFLYVYAGSSVPTIQEIVDNGTGSIFSTQILIAFVLLGIFPIAVKKIMARLRPPAFEIRNSKS